MYFKKLGNQRAGIFEISRKTLYIFLSVWFSILSFVHPRESKALECAPGS